MDAKAELEGNYLRHHPSEKELGRYEQEYLECCLIPEMEEKAVRKGGGLPSWPQASGKSVNWNKQQVRD
ncbi:MAG: hypothetical protein KKH78_02615 [Candidatus Altiarchaeota archaeon]|nr:hypothetical protein [Candidatus Altiarchaeota archaeon]